MSRDELLRDKACIVGIGRSEYGKRGALESEGTLRLALHAIHDACRDAGIDPKQLDGFSSYSDDAARPPGRDRTAGRTRPRRSDAFEQHLRKRPPDHLLRPRNRPGVYAGRRGAALRAARTSSGAHGAGTRVASPPRADRGDGPRRAGVRRTVGRIQPGALRGACVPVDRIGRDAARLELRCRVLRSVHRLVELPVHPGSHLERRGRQRSGEPRRRLLLHRRPQVRAAEGHRGVGRSHVGSVPAAPLPSTSTAGE